MDEDGTNLEIRFGTHKNSRKKKNTYKKRNEITVCCPIENGQEEWDGEKKCKKVN